MKIIATLSFLLASVSCFSQTGSGEKWIRMVKQEYAIQAPVTWSIDSSKQMGTDLVVFSMLENGNDRFRDNVNVLIHNVAGMNIDLARYTSISTGRIKQMAPDSRIEESKTITTKKGAFQKIMYTATQGGFKLRFEQYYFITGKKAYAVTLTTEADKFETFRPVGEAILNSFELTGR